MAKNGWIAVKEKLPEFEKLSDSYYESKIVLMTDGNDIFIGCFFGKEKDNPDFDSFPCDEYGILGKPTHWQELPDLPKKGVKKL